MTGCELCVRPPLALHVLHVVLVGAHTQMSRVHAQRVIALVHDTIAGRDWAVMNLV